MKPNFAVGQMVLCPTMRKKDSERSQGKDLPSFTTAHAGFLIWLHWLEVPFLLEKFYSRPKS